MPGKIDAYVDCGKPPPGQLVLKPHSLTPQCLHTHTMQLYT